MGLFLVQMLELKKKKQIIRKTQVSSPSDNNMYYFILIN